MAPSTLQIQANSTIAALKAAFDHFTSSNYPPEWDLRFHITFAVFQSLLMITNKFTAEEFQAMTTRPLPPPKGMWVIPVDVPPSEFVQEEVSELVRKVITKLGPINKLEVTVANIAGEWQGEKASPDLGSSLLSRQQQFDRLTNDAKSEAVILYFHGGAYVVASPDVLRPTTRRLARDCGGRVFSVRYRLAPQQPFPAALIDAVMAYKYLIDPPAGAMHSPIDPGKIVFAGDSAGGGLAVALMVFLAYAAPAFPLPAGVIGASPWLDLTHCFPSARINRGLDYLPNPWEGPAATIPSPAWPLPEPRYHYYSDDPLHPLVSPVVVAGELPKCPPVLLIIGDNEFLRDESIYFASRFSANGGTIRLQNYQAMPHVFQMFKGPAVEKSFAEYAKFIHDVTTSDGKIQTELQIFNGKGILLETPLDFENYPIAVTKEQLLARMQSEIERRREQNARLKGLSARKS